MSGFGRVTMLGMMMAVGCSTAERFADCSDPLVTCASGLTCATYFDIAGQERSECVVGCSSRYCLDAAACREAVVNDGPMECFDHAYPAAEIAF